MWVFFFRLQGGISCTNALSRYLWISQKVHYGEFETVKNLFCAFNSICSKTMPNGNLPIKKHGNYNYHNKTMVHFSKRYQPAKSWAFGLITHICWILPSVFSSLCVIAFLTPLLTTVWWSGWQHRAVETSEESESAASVTGHEEHPAALWRTCSESASDPPACPRELPSHTGVHLRPQVCL